MTKLLGISVCALGLMVSVNATTGCKSSDKKPKQQAAAKDSVKKDAVKPGDVKQDDVKPNDVKPNDVKPDDVNKDGDVPGNKGGELPNKQATAEADSKLDTTQTADSSAAVVAAGVSRLKLAADEVCACKDEACGKQVAKRMGKWMGATLGKLAEPQRMMFMVELQKKTKAHMERGKKCADRLSSAAAPGKMALAVKQLSQIADTVCACKDLTCAARNGNEAATWARNHRRTKFDPAQLKSLKKVQTRFIACHAKLEAGAAKPK